MWRRRRRRPLWRFGRRHARPYFGHRRDVAGYAHCLEAFDTRLPEHFAAMRLGNGAVITADHGNDPGWRGADRTREQVPILVFGPGIEGRPIGRRETLADIGASLAVHLDLPPTAAGRNVLCRAKSLS